MAKFLGKLQLWQKIVLVVGAFVLPFGALAFFTFQAYEEHIHIATLEQDGTATIRPMAALLEQLNLHELLTLQHRAGQKQLEAEIVSLQQQIDRSFDAITTAQRRYAKSLSFTAEGMEATGRGHAWLDTVRNEWQELKDRWSKLTPEQSHERHNHLGLDVQAMIAHVGDISTLVLDPTLDSYYVMDVAVFVMPVFQERIIQLVTRTLPLLDEAGAGNPLEVAGIVSMLRDSDLPRINRDYAIALLQDPKHYSKSETLERELKPRVESLRRETEALLVQASAVAGGNKDIPRDQFLAAGKRAEAAALALWHSSLNELDVLIRDRENYWRNRRLQGSLLTAAALGLSTLLAWVVIKRITRPLRNLTDASRAVASKGDLSVVINNPDSDEIGQLSRAFAAMIERFRTVATVAEKLAEGDLAVDLKPLSGRDVMGQAIDRMVGNLASVARLAEKLASGDLRVKVSPLSNRDVMGSALVKMVDNLSTLAGHVQKAAIVMNASVTDIAATSKQQQATTSEVAATTTEIGATSKEIYATSKELLKTVNEVSEVAEDTANLANSGQSSLGQMEETMGVFVEAVSSINGKLAVLNEKAANINQVVTTITKVADQTNLLSLNAAIEAEKAGEYGRGFAVVATEIRRLADQTAVASYDIEQMVKEMQSAVAAGVMGMDKFAEQVRRGVQEVKSVSGQLGQIIQHVQALTPRVLAVNEGMQAQATGADQITQALSQLIDATQQTADSLRQSNGSIEQLHEASRGMLNSLDGFKLRTA